MKQPKLWDSFLALRELRYGVVSGGERAREVGTNTQELRAKHGKERRWDSQHGHPEHVFRFLFTSYHLCWMSLLTMERCCVVFFRPRIGPHGAKSSKQAKTASSVRLPKKL
jgi:hypothetical protein